MAFNFTFQILILILTDVVFVVGIYWEIFICVIVLFFLRCQCFQCSNCLHFGFDSIVQFQVGVKFVNDAIGRIERSLKNKEIIQNILSKGMPGIK